MAKFRLVAEVTISIATEVEAATPAEALEIAESREMARLCHQCATGEPEQEWVASELDGDAMKVRIEEG